MVANICGSPRQSVTHSVGAAQFRDAVYHMTSKEETWHFLRYDVDFLLRPCSQWTGQRGIGGKTTWPV